MFGAEGGGGGGRELAESSRDEEVLGGCSCSRTSPRVPWLTLGDEHTNTTNRDRRLLWAAPSGSKHTGCGRLQDICQRHVAIPHVHTGAAGEFIHAKSVK
jgi:hypothetical protein